MNPTLPDNFKQLSASQKAIYAAEALREASDSSPSGHKATLRKQVREYFGIADCTAERAERLLKLSPELAAQVKAGTRSLPKGAQEWKALEGQLAPPEDSSNSNSSEDETPASKTVWVSVKEETPAPKTVKISLQVVADQMRISRTSVATAAAIKQASPEIAAQVAAGKLSLNKAAKMAGASKGYTKGSKADAVTEEGEKLLTRCAEHLKAIHAEFPGFTVLEIAKGCITAAKHFIDGKYSPPEWATAAK
jgi:hypothetical protein